jgi:hypothetical protein
VIVRRSAIATLAVVLVLAGCTSEDDKEPSPAITPPSSVAATTTSVSAPPSEPVTAPTTPTAPVANEIRISVAGGKVTGGGRHKIPKGTTLRLVVSADVSDEVHVHGYDKKADVAPGADATIEVVANVPGIFEVELEKKGLELAQLEVS